ALAFYEKLSARAPGDMTWFELDETLRGAAPAFGLDDTSWARGRAAHAGHQLGLDILALLPLIADKTGFYDLRLEDDLTVHIPERLHDPKHQEAMRTVLVPPPGTRAGEADAALGGSRPAAVHHDGRALRQGRPTLHHRGHEDVQQGVRELRGHRDRGARGERHGRPQGAAAVPDPARRGVRRGGSRRARAATPG